MQEDPAYIVDIQGLAPCDRRDVPSSDGSRPWIGVRFDCCGVYLRIYRNRTGTAYEGACPRCRRRVHVAIGPEGTDRRFFRAV